MPGDGKRYWLCRECHLSGCHKGAFSDASGFRAINGHLLKEHKIGQDGKPITVKPGPLKKHLKYGPRSYHNHNFHAEKQRLVVSAFPDWVILQNLTFRQATSAVTVAMFQLLRRGTASLFHTSATSLLKQINKSYCCCQNEIQLLFHGAKSRVHLSSNL